MYCQRRPERRPTVGEAVRHHGGGRRPAGRNVGGRRGRRRGGPLAGAERGPVWRKVEDDGGEGGSGGASLAAACGARERRAGLEAPSRGGRAGEICIEGGQGREAEGSGD